MTRIPLRWLAVLMWLVPAVPLAAHHSLANYDTTTAVRVTGTVVQVHLINPHSIIYLEGRAADGLLQRWAVEGPAVQTLTRSGQIKDVVKPGEMVEVCGYLPKERTMWQIANPDGATSLAGQLLNGESLTRADGQQQRWGDYGVHKCFGPDFKDQHAKP